MMDVDSVITLPSGTEISVEAALGDLARAADYLINDAAMDDGGQGMGSDLQHVAELLVLLVGQSARLQQAIEDIKQSKLDIERRTDAPDEADEDEHEEWVCNLDSEEYGRYQSYDYVLGTLEHVLVGSEREAE